MIYIVQSSLLWEDEPQELHCCVFDDSLVAIKFYHDQIEKMETMFKTRFQCDGVNVFSPHDVPTTDYPVTVCYDEKTIRYEIWCEEFPDTSHGIVRFTERMINSNIDGLDRKFH